MHNLVSIIVPVYNVEKYLEQCVYSLLKQTFKNIEVILVDDGSTDKSGELCDRYGAADKRVKVIHINNHGAWNARNVGINCCSGECITFIDSDDYIENDYIERLYDILIKTRVDIVQCGIQITNEDKEVIRKSKKGKTTYFDNRSALRELLRFGCIRQELWGKLYAAHLFQDIRCPNSTMAEDMDVVYRVIINGANVAFYDDDLYVHRIRKGSIMSSGFKADHYAEVNIVDRLMDEIDRKYPDFHTLSRDRRMTTYCNLLYRMMKSTESHFKMRQELVHKIKGESLSVLTKSNNMKLKIKILSCLAGKRCFKFVYYIAQLK